MAGKIPAGTFNTRVNLDGDQSVKTLRQLKTEVSALTSGWKAQEAQLKSSGDALGAAKTKYEGLSASVKHQEDYISKLRSEQSKLDNSTNKGSEDFAKMEKQIAAATVKLESMSSQQSRAKSSMDYYKSGVAEAQKELTRISETSKSYVTRLQAEGKATQAAKAEASGLGSQYSKMETIYRAQVTELNKIATASGKSSEAYAKQSVHVNETATKMAQAKTRMGELNAEIKKANPSVFTRIKTAIAGTNKQAEKTPSLFKKIVAGGLVTNAISNGFSALTSAMKSTISSGLDLVEAGEKSAAAWSAMGKSASDVKSLGNQVGDLSTKSGLAIATLGGMQKTIDTMTHGNTQMTENITAGVTAIGTASRMSGDQISAFSKSMTRVVASGSLTSTTLARMQKQAPALGAQLAKAAGVSQDAFAKMVANGKVSSTDFLNLVSKAGKNSSDVYKEFGKTAEGAKAQTDASWDQLKKKMAAPLLEVKNTGMSELASLMTSPVVQNAATSLGKGLAYVGEKAKDMLAYVSAHKKDVTGITTDLWNIAKITGSYVWDSAKRIIKDIAGWLGVGGKNAKTMKDPLETVHDILDKIVKNKSGIQTTVKVLAGLWATKKVFEFAGALGHVYSGLKSLGESKIGQSIASNLKKLSGSKLGTATAVVTIAYDAISDIKDLTKAFGKSGTVGQKFKAVGETAGTAIGGGIGFFFGGPLGAAVGASIGKVVGGWAGTATKKFTDGWNAKAKPKDWLGKLGFDAHKGATGIAKWWNGIQKQNDKANAQMEKQQAAANKKSKKDWDNFWSGVGNGWNNFWTNYTKKEKKNQADAKKRQDAQNKAISKAMSSWWSSITKGWSNFWSGIGKWATQGLTSLQKGFTSKLNSIHKGWNNMWSSVGKFFSNFLNSIKSAGSSALSWLGSRFSSGLSLISRGWSRTWNGMSKMFSGIWSGIKSAARTGLNGVIGIINGAIGGINWVWQKFTGHNAIKKIQKLAQGGIVGNMHVVMVNDGAGPDWKELYQLPNGQYGMMQQRNAVMMAPEGTRVWNGKETKSIMQMAGIQHYANGGIVGAVGNFFKSGWDKVTAIGDWLKHPIKNMEKAISSAISGMTASTSMFTSLGKGVVSKMVSGVSAWAQKQLKKLEDTLSPAEPKGTGVQRWKPSVIKALKANGFDATAGQVAAWLRVIARESNGNPKAINNWDSNAKAGHPSKGLVQTIDSTFNAYAHAGHKNIWNGYDDLLAGINYMKHIYGSGASAFRRVSGSEGYANGGFANTASIFGEDGLEAAIP